MFPITDLSRADDIRMRRRRAVWLLAGIVVIPTILFSGHGGRKSSADIGDADGDVDASGQLQDFGHDATVLSATGSSLTVSLSCASSITLVPRQDQAGRVSVSTRGSRPAGPAWCCPAMPRWCWAGPAGMAVPTWWCGRRPRCR